MRIKKYVKKSHGNKYFLFKEKIFNIIYYYKSYNGNQEGIEIRIKKTN